MNIIIIIKFMRISCEVSSVAATKLPSGWWPLELVLTSNRSTMVSYEKIIKGFLKNPLVFKWELFKDF